MGKCLYCYKSVDGKGDYHEKCIKTFFGTSQAPKIPYTLDEMAELAEKVVRNSIAVPGVQPKLSMSLFKDGRSVNENRLTVVGALGGQYIFKPPSANYTEMPENEHITMRMAEAFGLSVVPSCLVRLASGELSYITKRIDRTNDGEKLHMLDMFQITEAFDKYKSSMEKIGKALSDYSVNTLLDKVFFLELTLFCFVTGNNDMHLKNFSMIEGNRGWVLSPAYDLLNVSILLPDDKEELALTLGGKKRKFKRADFVDFGNKLGLTSKQIEGVFKRLFKNKEKASKWIDNSFLSDEMKEAYKGTIESRYKRLV